MTILYYYYNVTPAITSEQVRQTTTTTTTKKHVQHAVGPVVSAAAVTKRDAIPAARGSTGHPLAAPTGLPLSFRRRAALVRARTRVTVSRWRLGRLRLDRRLRPPQRRRRRRDNNGETLHVRSECDD